MKRMFNSNLKAAVTAFTIYAITIASLCFAPLKASGQYPPTIWWSEEVVEVTVSPGGRNDKIVTFLNSSNLYGATVEVSPEISNLMFVHPNPIYSGAWQVNNLFLFINIPEGTSEGAYEGTIQIKNGEEILPQTLRVVINVRKSSVDGGFTLFSNPEDPLLLRAKKPNGDIVEYFGEKDENGIPTALTSITVRTADGQVTRIKLDEQARPVQIIASNGVVFQIRWLSATNILLTAISPEGSVQVNVAIDLTKIPSSQKPFSSTTSSWSSLPLTRNSPIARTRRSNTVLEALTSPKSAMGFKTLAATTASTNASLVNVTRCGSPVNNADVLMTVIPPNGDGYTIPAVLTQVQGQYKATIPTKPSPAQSAEDLCVKVAEVLSKGCDALQVFPPGSELYICLQLAAAVAAIGTPAAGAAILAACEAAFLIATTYCNTLGYSGPVPGGTSIAESLCKNVSEVVDSFTEGNLYMFPLVFIPGEGLIDDGTTGQNAPSSGPFPTFNVDAGGSVKIASFTTTPADPAPFQNYIAEALIECAPPGTVVTISVSGTDGYFNKSSVTISGDANVTLTVPGAEESVVDTITVQVSNGPSRQIVLVF